MIRINLIPPEYLEKINRKVMIAKAAAAGLAVLAVFVAVSLWHFTRSASLESQRVQLEAELKTLQKDVEQVKAIEAQIAEVQRYLDAITQITRNRMIYTNLLQAVVRDLPPTLWFTGMSTSFKDGNVAVTFSVFSNSATDLAYWIGALESEKKYADVNTGAISVSETENGRVFSSVVTLNYTGG